MASRCMRVMILWRGLGRTETTDLLKQIAAGIFAGSAAFACPAQSEGAARSASDVYLHMK